MKKYLIVPDFVTSNNDGDRHFISAQQLIKLYGVDAEECHVASHPAHLEGFNIGGENPLIILAPRYDGNYQLPQPREV